VVNTLMRTLTLPASRIHSHSHSLRAFLAGPACLQLAVGMDTQDMRRLAARHGSRLLQGSTVGRRPYTSAVTAAAASAVATAAAVVPKAGAGGEPGARQGGEDEGRRRQGRIRAGSQQQQHPGWSDELLARRL
jgi:hypothetical protein